MNNSRAFKTFMGNQVWDLENVFEYINVKKEFGNSKHIVKNELSLRKDFTIGKITVLLCELLRYKGTINYDYIKENFDTFIQITRNTINKYEMLDKLDTLAEYLGGAVNLSINRKGYMYHYKKEADNIDRGVNETYYSLTEELRQRTGYDLIQCNKIMFYTWLLFNCNILEIGVNAMKLVLKESIEQ